ncbi:hypothetical protein AB1Y20_015731 [Prymnesium parvum]|uniref:Uncharacterized protein n=1 Tax=Prymnesium parvum TaxID=97485 RepID=A0AB34JZE2_PRYPA
MILTTTSRASRACCIFAAARAIASSQSSASRALRAVRCTRKMTMPEPPQCEQCDEESASDEELSFACTPIPSPSPSPSAEPSLPPSPELDPPEPHDTASQLRVGATALPPSLPAARRRRSRRQLRDLPYGRPPRRRGSDARE